MRVSLGISAIREDRDGYPRLTTPVRERDKALLDMSGPETGIGWSGMGSGEGAGFQNYATLIHTGQGCSKEWYRMRVIIRLNSGYVSVRITFGVGFGVGQD